MYIAYPNLKIFSLFFSLDGGSTTWWKTYMANEESNKGNIGHMAKMVYKSDIARWLGGFMYKWPNG